MAKKTAPRKRVSKKDSSQNKKTLVIVKFDCGYHNHLSIRGEGAGLSWFHGTHLKNIKADEWIFEIRFPGHEIEYKILINDQVFEIGENRKVKNGETVIIHPKFH